MLPLIGLLTIITLAVMVIRIGATALELTGLSPEVAGFQAQSAFSGVGFTTSESEAIVNHPVRRKIIRILILFGSAGITTTIATFILTFVGQSNEELTIRGLILISGLMVIFLVSRSKIFGDLLKRIIVKALSKNKALQIQDYQELLGIHQGYSVARVKVNPSTWIESRPLKDLKLHEEGTLILSIHRRKGNEERFIVPSGESIIQAGDFLTVYGPNERAQGLVDRPAGAEGDVEHRQCCGIQMKEVELHAMQAEAES